MSRGPDILREEIIQQDDARRHEAEPNPEEEGEAPPPDEIDGEKEGTRPTKDRDDT